MFGHSFQSDRVMVVKEENLTLGFSRKGSNFGRRNQPTMWSKGIAPSFMNGGNVRQFLSNANFFTKFYHAHS
ncbi:MAG: hypothetical protein JWM68_2401 [Verrucomicrobiales bacterium]|nr:hypothetical protein [Verrucomicrobiales bacterium]